MKDKKKEKKRKRSEVDGGNHESTATPSTTFAHDDDDDDADENAKEKRRLRREERKQLLEKVPKVDENGISYTKLQLRRMAKRVARGLDPIESEAEKQQRFKDEAELRRQEQDELEGIIRKPHPSDADNESSSDQEHNVHKEHVEDEEQQQEEDDDDEELDNRNIKQEIEIKTIYKNKRKKPVPEDYVCSACQNKHTPLHWIYDCPDKKTVRGTNQLSKRLRGLHNPSTTKVFVSGLPFSMTSKELKQLFETTCGPVVRAKAITFPDSGRCKGQGFVTFQEEEGSRRALTIMNGKQLDLSGDDNNNKKENNTKKGGKQLVLKVTKVLNRKVSKEQTVSN